MKLEYLKKLGRVKDIPYGWQLTTIGKVCKIKNNLRKPISVDERAKIQGAYPYYGPTGLLDHINEYLVEGEFALIGEDGDHFLKPLEKAQTLLINGKFNVNNHAHVIQGTEWCSAKWFYLYFHHRDITNFLSRQGANRYKLNKETLSRMPILVPLPYEQDKIFKINSEWNKAIKKAEHLIVAKQKQFDWLAARLINQAGYHRDCVSDFTAEVSVRNRNSKIDRVLSVTNHSGFVLPEEQFERRVASSNLSNYKVVKRGQYAYNPSRINVGSIARLDKWDIGVLSPMYVVFKLDESRVESDYFLHWLSSHEAKQRIKNSAQGSVRETVGFGDLCLIPIPLPTLRQQQKVARVLNTAKEEIALLEKLADKYRTQKRGLMQKLLTGEWRVKSLTIDNCSMINEIIGSSA